MMHRNVSARHGLIAPIDRVAIAGHATDDVKYKREPTP